MPLEVALGGVGVLLGASPCAIVLARSRAGGRLVYGVCLLAGLALMAVAGWQLLAGPGSPAGLRLPVGLPWVGAHFRMDPLAAFFLVVTNLGGAAASLFAIGYGLHEKAPGRVLPFYPAFLAAMNLVVLADDAFTFLKDPAFLAQRRPLGGVHSF